jgi:hypothetical protein
MSIGAEDGGEGGVGIGGGFAVKGSPSVPGTRDVVRDGLVYFSKNFQIVIKGGTLDKLVERLSAEHNTGSPLLLNSTSLASFGTIFDSCALVGHVINLFVVYRQ